MFLRASLLLANFDMSRALYNKLGGLKSPKKTKKIVITQLFYRIVLIHLPLLRDMFSVFTLS